MVLAYLTESANSSIFVLRMNVGFSTDILCFDLRFDRFLFENFQLRYKRFQKSSDESFFLEKFFLVLDTVKTQKNILHKIS